MRKLFQNEENIKKIFVASVSGIIIATICYVLYCLPSIFSFVEGLIMVLMPFIFGLGLAYLLSFPMDRFEAKLPAKWQPRVREIVAALTIVTLFIACVILFIVIMIPQLVLSFRQLSGSIESLTGKNNFFENFLGSKHISKELLEQFSTLLSGSFQTVISYIQAQLPVILGATLSGVKMIGNIIIGVIVALYILLDKQNLKRQIRKVFLAFLNEKQFNHAASILRLSASKFGNFFNGKILDSLIIGLICFFCMVILRLDYAVFISFVIGVTNIIPFFGPFIGAIPSIFILLILDPLQAFWFMILIVVLQQLDGNIIGPRILGDSVGLSSLWIIFAIIVGGAYFGVAGMILGVPFLAVVYFLFCEFVNERLRRRKTAEAGESEQS